MHIATGRVYRGREVVQGPVAYCTFEGAFAFPDRIMAIAEGMALGGQDIPFYYSPERQQFTKVGRSGDVIKGIADTLETAPVLVVLDTLNRSIDGDENAGDDMTHYTKCAEDICDEFSCAVIIVHHCGIEAKRPRGHSSLTGTCDAQIKVSRHGKDHGRMVISSKVEVMKDGPEDQEEFSILQPISMQIDGVTVESCYIEGTPSPPAGDFNDPIMKQGFRKKAFSIVQQMLKESDGEAIDYTELRIRCEAAATGKRTSRNRVANRALAELLERGLIEMVDNTKVRLGEHSNVR